MYPYTSTKRCSESGSRRKLTANREQPSLTPAASNALNTNANRTSGSEAVFSWGMSSHTANRGITDPDDSLAMYKNGGAAATP